MKCQECEINIYLYDTLKVQEKQDLEMHLLNCPDCAIVFQTVKEEQTLIQTASSFTVSPLDNQRLTDNVMSHVFGTKVQKEKSKNTEWDYLFKYSFIVLCMILTLSFLSEFFRNPISNADRNMTRNNTDAVLKSPTLQEIHKEGSSPSISLYAMAKSNAEHLLINDNNKTQNNENN